MTTDQDLFDSATLDKVYRIMAVLQRIGTVQFLRDRLCIIGGTALNLVELPRIERLSVDLDFNFHQTSLSEK